MTQKRVGIMTLGCKVNQYESEAIAEAFEAAGYTVAAPDTACDAYVINTCTVTAESDRKARQVIRRVATAHPTAAILVTGCLAQSHPNEVAKLPGVDYICGSRNKLSLIKAAMKIQKEGKPQAPQIVVPPLSETPFEPMCITHFERTRAYVKIEDGCENRCAYCAIPAARGPVCSKAPEEILREVEGLIQGGCREVVLTGIETASFGRDLKTTSLIELLEAVDRIPGDFRIRLGSLDPSLMKEDFVARAARLSHLAPHFHLSIQSGSSHVLAGMRRKYNREMALAGVRRLRAAFPNLELTTDFIVGFPGEREEDFNDTVSFAKEAAFLQMHVFAYSRREGTPAAAMKEQVDSATKKARSAALIEVGNALHRERLALALKTPMRTVLFESFENGIATGHTDSFLEVSVHSPVPLHGELLQVRLTAIENNRLFATLER